MFRLATTDDIEKLMIIETQLFKPGWTKQHFKYEIEENQFSTLLVLEHNNEIIGYVGYWVLFENGEITTLAIHPQYQNQGYGKQLFTEALSQLKMKNVESVTLEVRKSNLKAQQLYEYFNFVKIGERLKYYGDEDALLMGVGL